MGNDVRVNCWVFFTAQNNTELLPRLNPRNTWIDKIVAVGLAGEFNKINTADNSTAVIALEQRKGKGWHIGIVTFFLLSFRMWRLFRHYGDYMSNEYNLFVNFFYREYYGKAREKKANRDKFE
ncbi:unnamed protein product [Cylicostephanus goldi]|uniref:Uncharacterized protein n=1 Tax=Cylicostephanus goldi TaxID=71465 RepID=A0A3P6RXV0_CYLGO|nr:unnamed protein product [Cylicostephanus goldi]